MDSFPWNDNFLTGQNDIDQQHLYLVKLINQFIELSTQNKVSFKEVNKVYSELESYAIYHFSEEEKLMRESGIYEGFLKAHIHAHHTFLSQINQMKDELAASNLRDGKHLLDFLVHWLILHILQMDKNMGRQIEKIAAGMSAKEAFQSELKTTDASTEALVGALNHLFSEVAKRNQELSLLNQTLENKVAERTSELQKLNNELQHLSVTDQLTNLPNRRFAISHLNKLWAESNQTGNPLSCLMIDVDNFKIVNDTYGHDAGDKVLKELTQQLQQTLRNDDVVCRLGGDEFFVICENTTFDGAIYVAQLLSERVKRLVVSVGDGQWLGSISIGVAAKLASMKQIDELMKIADQGVYLAKQAGKGCVKSVNV